MLVCRRELLAGAGAAALMIGGGGGAAMAKKLTDKNLTKKDYDNNTETKSSVEGEKPTDPPTPLHELTDAALKALKAANAVRLLKGKDWRSKTPEERDQYLRNAKKTIPKDSKLVLIVSKGELWVVPPGEYEKLKKAGTVTEWTDAQREKLPKSVAGDGGVSQSDIRGTPVVRRQPRKERP